MSAENRRDKLAAQLSAYLDEELSAQEQAHVERLLEEDPAARQLLRELEHTTRLVASLPRHGAPPSLVEDVQLQLERSELLGGSEEQGSEPPVRRGSLKAIMALAAMVMIVVGGTWMVTQLGDQGPGRPGTQLAQNELKTEEPAELGLAEPKHGMTAKRARRSGDKGPERAEVQSAPTAPVRDQRSYAQKLKAGATVAQAASGHSFAAEPLHLSVTVNSEAERQELLQRLAIHLGDLQVPDLGRRLAMGGEASAEAESFYLPGAPGVNFQRKTSRQVLVRVPVAQARGLVRTFQQSSRPGVEVAFNAGGGFEARGWEKAGAALALLDPAEPEVEVIALNVPEEPGKRGRGGSPFEQFAEGMKKTLSRTPQEGKPEAEEAVPAAAPEPAPKADKEKGESTAAQEEGPPQDAVPDAERAQENKERESLVKQRLAAAEAARRARMVTKPEPAPGAEIGASAGLEVIEPTYLELVIELNVKGEPAGASLPSNSAKSSKSNQS